MQIFKMLIIIFLISAFYESKAQVEEYFYQGRFEKFNGMMRSNHYEPDMLEDSLFKIAIKTAFPSDLIKYPEKYNGKLIHLIGIVDSVSVEQTGEMITFTFILENKYWDYIEDYSLQDEVMFISPKGGGQFEVIVKTKNLNTKDIEYVKGFPEKKSLFIVYGVFTVINRGLPSLTTDRIKYIDYLYYTTKVFSFEIARDNAGNVLLGSRR